MARYTCLIRIIICLWVSFIDPFGLSFGNDVPLPIGDCLQRREVLVYSGVELLSLNFCATGP